MKILVLGGGDSPEREVSLRSAKSVANAAREAGYEVIEADPSLEFQALDGLSPDTIIFPMTAVHRPAVLINGKLGYNLKKTGSPCPRQC
jgi:D-alanine-D-alanine ligase-like ATP-grasp enzyme